MTRTEMKTLKTGDIVCDKKNGCKYELLEVCQYHTAFSGIVYDLRLKPCDGGKDVYINSKRVSRC